MTSAQIQAATAAMNGTSPDYFYHFIVTLGLTAAFMVFAGSLLGLIRALKQQRVRAESFLAGFIFIFLVPMLTVLIFWYH